MGNFDYDLCGYRADFCGAPAGLGRFARLASMDRAGADMGRGADTGMGHLEPGARFHVDGGDQSRASASAVRAVPPCASSGLYGQHAYAVWFWVSSGIMGRGSAGGCDCGGRLQLPRAGGGKGPVGGLRRGVPRVYTPEWAVLAKNILTGTFGGII